MAEAQIVPGSIEAHALARHVRMSPQKARLVMDLIRGQKAQSALQTLQFAQKRAARHIEKVLRSAIANAERKADEAGAPLDVDELYVAKCFVNEGPRWKRLRPAPMAARSATRSAPHTCGWAWPSITLPRQNVWPRSKRKRRHKRAFAAPRGVFARR